MAWVIALLVLIFIGLLACCLLLMWIAHLLEQIRNGLRDEINPNLIKSYRSSINNEENLEKIWKYTFRTNRILRDFMYAQTGKLTTIE